MTPSAQRKCLHCREFFLPDRRNLYHQRYCSKPACRRQSKTKSQRRWLQKAENKNHFRGPENSQRVKEWRKHHPGYWRKKSAMPEEPLQDFCMAQAAQNEDVRNQEIPHALQDLCLMEPAVIVGLISTMAGSALQEDIASIAQQLRRKGQDILCRNATSKSQSASKSSTSRANRAA
jgi:hypothetical protein